MATTMRHAPCMDCTRSPSRISAAGIQPGADSPRLTQKGWLVLGPQGSSLALDAHLQQLVLVRPGERGDRPVFQACRWLSCAPAATSGVERPHPSCRTGMGRWGSVLSQVPKCEAPGAPSFVTRGTCSTRQITSYNLHVLGSSLPSLGFLSNSSLPGRLEPTRLSSQPRPCPLTRYSWSSSID